MSTDKKEEIKILPLEKNQSDTGGASAAIPEKPHETTQTVSDFEKLKLIYEKVSEQHRFYIAWRQYLLAGYFAVIAALLYTVFHLFSLRDEFVRYYSVNVAAVIPIVSLFFMWLDNRNRILYQNTQRVGAAIEKELNLKLEYNGKKVYGLYYDLDKSYLTGNGFISRLNTHTWAIRIFLGICSVAGIFLALVLHNKIIS